MLRKIQHVTRGRTISFILITRFLLSFLTVIILFSFFLGILKIITDIYLYFPKSIEEFIRQIIVDSVILLALVEVLRIAMSYLHDGRVKIRYIVDTVLIVLLNEVITLWFKGGINVPMVAMLSVILLTLICIRVLAIRFSPKKNEEGFE